MSKRVIRKNMFETNSSSVHAICVDKLYPTDFPKTVNFKLGEFGWGFDVCKSTSDRLSYLYTAIYELSRLPGQGMWETKSLDDYMEKSDKFNFYITTLKEMLLSLGIQCTFEDPVETHNEFFYIDHCEDLVDWLDNLINDQDKLIRYLFGPESKIILTNDNYDYRDSLYSNIDEDKVDVDMK